MDPLVVDRDIFCPHCGEPHNLLIDLSAGSQSYIEDCSVCCHPIDITVNVGGDELTGIDVRAAQ